MPSTFADVVAVIPVSSHSYSIDLHDDWCIGTVPNGGFITSTFLLVARTHMQITHPTRSEPHPINLHLEFLRRTSAGHALFTVEDVKLGSRVSNLHITLSQKQGDDGEYENEVQGYVTMSNFTTETGLSLPTENKLQPPPLPVDLAALQSTGEDHNWLRRFELFREFRRATRNIRMHLVKPEWRQPPSSYSAKNVIDQWVQFSPHGREGKWTNDCLGYVVDMFPQIVEGYVNPESEEDANHGRGGGGDSSSRARTQTEPRAKFWYPTLTLNLDVKKLLPDSGVEWLFVRVHSKVIRNGRLDLNVEVRDVDGDIVALSSHSSLIVDVGRNLVRRNGGGGGRNANPNAHKL